MGRSFYLGTDAELYTGSDNFSTKISLTPTAYGLVAAQATAYAAKNVIWKAAYLAASDPEQRTKGKVAAKNQAKSDIKSMAADLAKIISGTATVTNEQKLDLGLSVRATPTPVPAPTDAPNIDLLLRDGTMVRIKLHDGTVSRRAKPAGVLGASVFSHVGPTPPPMISGWTFETNTTKSVMDLTFDGSLPAGTVVWLTAFWYTRRGLSGPGCAPFSTTLAGGAMSMAA